MGRGLRGVLVRGIERYGQSRALEHGDVRERVPDGYGALLGRVVLLYELADVDPLVVEVQVLSALPRQSPALVAADLVRYVLVESELVAEHLGRKVYPAADDDAGDPIVPEACDRLLDPSDQGHGLEHPGYVAYAQAGVLLQP